MVIGGIAVIAHGVQRMTTDIDVVIQGDRVRVSALLTLLKRYQIEPRLDNAEAFAAANLVLLARHRPTQVDLDLSFGWTAFEREALAACARTRYGSVTVPMARADDLLVFKAMAGRPRDVEDALTLLTLYPDLDLKRARRRVNELAQLAETPELSAGLEHILQLSAAMAAARASRSTESKKTAKKVTKKKVAKKKVAKKNLRRRH